VAPHRLRRGVLTGLYDRLLALTAVYGVVVLLLSPGNQVPAPQ
jgi:hypothetical protein